MAAAMNGSTTIVSASKPRKIWRSETSIPIPSADILTFAFANLGQYDENKPIYVDANDPSSYISARDARATIRRLVKGLKACGLEEGDRVCLVSSNNIYFPILWLATIAAGGIVVGTNPLYSSLEFNHHFKTTNPRYVIAQSECLRAVEEAISACNISLKALFILCGPHQTVPQGYQPWQTLLEHGECDWETGTVYYKSVGEKLAAFNSTSGTTGLPKAAAVSHRFVVAQTSLIEQRFREKPYQASQLVCLPAFHAFAAQIALVLPLRLGITTYLLPRYNLRDFSRIIKTYNITDTAVVPPIVTSLLRAPKEDRQSLRSLRYVLCAGAPIAAALQSELYHLLSPDAVIGQVWGTTELGWSSMFNWNEKDMSGSVGRLLPGVELKLIGDDGIEVEADSVHGEAYVRSPSAFSHYHDNKAATASAFDNEGFYRTGDRVYMSDSKIFVDGRVKDTMKVKGFQVSPMEIESVLLQHPIIADAAVIGINAFDNDGLEVTLPRAYIVRQQASPADQPEALTEKEVIDFAASRLVAYKKLTGGVVFIDEIPRNATGKILRRLLDDSSQPESPAYRSETSGVTSGSDAGVEAASDGS